MANELNLDVLKQKAAWYEEGYLSFAHHLADAAPSLIAEVEHYRALHKLVMNEQCPTDEVHCACVPVLRAEVERLRAENEQYRRQAEGERELAKAKLQGHHISPGSGMFYEV